MSIPIPQNFYKETITRAVSLTGATNIYVSALPTPAEGWLAISPASATLREIVYYTAKGTDGNGSYVTVTLANRGLGGTTAQTHAIGEPVRMNVEAETIQAISDAMDQIVAAGAQDASTTTKGLVEEATDAEVSAHTDTGTTGARLFVPPSKISLAVVPVVRTYNYADSPAVWTKPAGLQSIDVELWAGGGSGGSGAGGGNAGGGGGGAYNKIHIYATNISTNTVAVVVGNGGASVTTNNGNPGGNSSFGSFITVYGGGAGGGNGVGGGGGGGGLRSVGSVGTSVGGNGGAPAGSLGGNSAIGASNSGFGGAGGGDSTYAGGEAVYGGGGGGGESNGGGGNSLYGGGGGGGSHTAACAGGTSIYGGNGGSGGDADPLPTAGAVPGGGGGGGASSTASGAGGAGRVIITEHFV